MLGVLIALTVNVMHVAHQKSSHSSLSGSENPLHTVKTNICCGHQWQTCKQNKDGVSSSFTFRDLREAM